LTLSENILILCAILLRSEWVKLGELDNQSDWTHHWIPSLFVLSLAIAVPPASLALAGVAPNSGASALSQSCAKVAPAKPPVEDNKERHEDGKESAK